MFRAIRSLVSNRRWLLWLAAGIVIRLLFIVFPRTIDDDTWDYLELGRNLLHHGVYGLGIGDDLAPSLFRLPGYPIVLAVCNQLFGSLPHAFWLVALYIFQSIADIGAGLLLAAFARRHISPRAAEIAFALAMLCPFTAAEAGIAMTECLSVFAIALGIYALGRALHADRAGTCDTRGLILAACAAALAMILRPDGVLLFASLAAALLVYTLRGRLTAQGVRHTLALTSIYAVVALAPNAVWAVRNWEAFHVIQPLAPRYLGDPGDRANVGIYRWMRTWAAEYTTTAVVFWQVGVGPIDSADLPERAFDSPAQRVQTLALLDEYNHNISVTADLDNRFNALAAARIRAHPIRYYVTLPLMRVADMMFRPRTEELRLDVFWWNWSEEPGQTLASCLLGLLNLAYVAAAVWAFLRRRVPWAWMLGGYVLLRCLLLGTMENSEPRYTIQLFPIFIVAAAAALTPARPSAAPPSFADQVPPASVVRQSTSD